MGAKQPGHLHLSRWHFAFDLGGNYGGWGCSFFGPFFECKINIVLGIVLWADAKFTEIVGSGTAGAMLHSRHHIEPYEGIGLLFAHGRQNALVVVDRIERRNGGILPTMIDKQFSPARPAHIPFLLPRVWSG